MAQNPLVGRIIEDRWLLGRPIGRGGMSTVFEGVDQKEGLPVAVKVLKPGLKPELRSVERFRREARAASKVDHPNVVSIRGHGELDGGLYYLVMELIEGVNLQQAIHLEAPFGARRAVRIALQVASALARAHQHGVLHRDLKPGNILLLHKRGDPDALKIFDFGLAKILGNDEADTLTKAGMVFGTPEYMSPEQAVGKAVDGRCDVYALGAILYEMLVGRPPFQGESVFDTVRMHVAEPPPAPRDARSDVLIPPMLEGIVLRCLEKRPENRFDATHLMRVLKAVSGHLSQRRKEKTEEIEHTDPSRPTLGQGRANLFDPDEAAADEYEQLRRHRQETLRRMTHHLRAHPAARRIAQVLEEAARLEQQALDRGADLAVAESAAEEARINAQERISALRLEYIDRQMEATSLKEHISTAKTGGEAQKRLDEVVVEMEALEGKVLRSEKELRAGLESLEKRQKLLAQRAQEAEKEVDLCYDEAAVLVRAAAGVAAKGELAELFDDLQNFDTWMSQHKTQKQKKGAEEK